MDPLGCRARVFGGGSLEEEGGFLQNAGSWSPAAGQPWVCSSGVHIASLPPSANSGYNGE